MVSSLEAEPCGNLVSVLSVLVRVSMAEKRHYDYGNPYTGKFLIGVALQFRGLTCHHHGGKYGSAQADVVVER